MALEREYNIPLRKEWLKVPKYKRAKKAIAGIKKFLVRHMKTDDEKNVKIGKYLNLKVWERGIKNPPHHINVKAVKADDGVVTAELVGAPVEVKPEKKEDKKGLMGKIAGAAKKEEPKAEEKKEEVPKEDPHRVTEKSPQQQEAAEHAADAPKEKKTQPPKSDVPEPDKDPAQTDKQEKQLRRREGGKE